MPPSGQGSEPSHDRSVRREPRRQGGPGSHGLERARWIVLIAQFALDAGGERLRSGAYLSFTNEIYCFETATGNASDIATYGITFTGFRVLTHANQSPASPLPALA